MSITIGQTAASLDIHGHGPVQVRVLPQSRIQALILNGNHQSNVMVFNESESLKRIKSKNNNKLYVESHRASKLKLSIDANAMQRLIVATPDPENVATQFELSTNGEVTVRHLVVNNVEITKGDLAIRVTDYLRFGNCELTGTELCSVENETCVVDLPGTTICQEPTNGVYEFESGCLRLLPVD